MYRSTKDFHDRITRGEKPYAHILINTHMGFRGYAERTKDDASAYLADGTYLADGSITAGSGLGLLETQRRLLSYSGFDRTVQPRKSDIMAAYNRKQQQRITITLDNADNHFSELIALEVFLSRNLFLYLGFVDLNINEHLRLFAGQIFETELDRMTCKVSAYES